MSTALERFCRKASPITLAILKFLALPATVVEGATLVLAVNQPVGADLRMGAWTNRS